MQRPNGKPQLNDAFQRARARLPQGEPSMAWPGIGPRVKTPARSRWKTTDTVRLLAPFDPVVWDRDRFERLWGWAYRFEAYTPAAKRCAVTTPCRCCGATR